MKRPPIVEWLYEDLVDYACDYIMKQLLAEGGRGFRQAVWLMLDLAIQWRMPKHKPLDKSTPTK